MMSRNGQATISNYLCFKRGYTEEEIKQTGLKQVVDDEKYAQVQTRDPYLNVAQKVFSNAGSSVQKSGFP